MVQLLRPEETAPEAPLDDASQEDMGSSTYVAPAAPAPDARGRLLAVAIGVGGFTLCAVGLLVMAINKTPSTEPVATVVETPRSMPTAEAPEAEEPRPSATEPPPVVEENEPALPDLPPLPDDSSQPPTAQRPLPATAETPPADPPARSADPAVAGSDPPEEAAIDPLDFDPASMDLVMLRGGKGKQPVDSSPPPVEAVPGTQDASTERPAEARVASLDRRLADRVENQQLWVERGATAFDPPTQVDLARRLNHRLPELVLPSAPLADAVRLWSDLAGVAVTIDPSALHRAGVSPQDPLTLRGQDETLGQLLLEGLRARRLTYAEQEGQLVLARLGGGRQLTRAYPVADLLGSEADALPLRDLLLQFALPQADAPELGVEGDTLVLTADSNTHFDLVVFLERLRHARGLSRTTSFPVELLRVSPPLAGLSPRLDRPTTFSFITPTPIADVLEHWRRSLGIEILVEWRSAAQMRLGPQSQVRCSARDQPWDVALDGVLGSLGLGWHAIDGRTVQVVSLDDLQHGAPRVEFYPLPSARVGHDVADRLAAALPATTVHFDLPSSMLLVRGAGAARRQAYAWLRGQAVLD